MENEEERRQTAGRRTLDQRFAVLERIVAEHHRWLEDMRVSEASERERQANIHVWRWWVRGEDNRSERRKLIAWLVAASAIIGPAVGTITTELINHLK